MTDSSGAVLDSEQFARLVALLEQLNDSTSASDPGFVALQPLILQFCECLAVLVFLLAFLAGLGLGLAFIFGLMEEVESL